MKIEADRKYFASACQARYGVFTHSEHIESSLAARTRVNGIEEHPFQCLHVRHCFTRAKDLAEVFSYKAPCDNFKLLFVRAVGNLIGFVEIHHSGSIPTKLCFFFYCRNAWFE